MKKLMIVSTAIAFALTAGVANACPKNTHLEGGTGPKHKGGKCVANTPAPAPMAMKMDANKPMAMKMDSKAPAMKMDAKKPMAMKMATKS